MEDNVNFIDNKTNTKRTLLNLDSNKQENSVIGKLNTPPKSKIIEKSNITYIVIDTNLDPDLENRFKQFFWNYQKPLLNNEWGSGSTILDIKKLSEDELDKLLLFIRVELKKEEINELAIEEKIIEWLEKYNYIVATTLINFYKTGRIVPEEISKILEALGLINNADLTIVRNDLFQYFIQDDSSVIRYGSIIGISNLCDKKLLPLINEALEKEEIVFNIGILESVKNQLERSLHA